MGATRFGSLVLALAVFAAAGRGDDDGSDTLYRVEDGRWAPLGPAAP